MICIYGLISKHKPKTDLTYVSSTPKINLEYDVNFKKIVNQINLKIQKLESIKIKNMPVIVYRGFAKRKISGSSYWQKNNYRVLMSDFDFGLNIHEFWYHNGYKLFYASIKDEINLKEYLHPLWIQEIFNVVKIDFDDIEFGKFKNSYIIFKNSFQGTTIVFIIDPIQENIQEKYLYNKKGYLIAEVQYEYDEKKSLKTIS